MSGGLLGLWRSRMHAARAARGLWASVERGARGMLSAWLLARLTWFVRVVQWLATFERGTGSGGGVLSCSQTCGVSLFLLLAGCRHGGDNGAFGLLNIDGNAKLTVMLRVCN